MIFKKMLFQEKEIGQFCKIDNVFFFFGNVGFDRQDLPVVFPQFQFREVKQVHGNKVIESTREVCEADGHYTSRSGIALLIKTADCIPILMAQGETIMALHSGWRGTLTSILTVGLQQFDLRHRFALAIGPHIQGNSFEVDQSLADQFRSTFSQTDFEVAPAIGTQGAGKTFIDLQKVLRHQLKIAGALAEPNFFSKEDTLSDRRYHSFRRDKELAGRNYSFVARLPD